ncbi:hypothetical protein Franean1_3012 [Parafrankia sp. EAN1pec]|nr:hypothetical protein Franean1_3012 [Frankia sp. EAN1pec]
MPGRGDGSQVASATIDHCGQVVGVPVDPLPLEGSAMFGLVASDPTVSRTVDRLAADVDKVLAAIDRVRAIARARVGSCAGSHAPDHQVSADDLLVVDLDATLVTAHSEKEQARPTFNRVVSASARTWRHATTPTTCWSSTRDRVTPPRTTPLTPSPPSPGRSNGSRAPTATGCSSASTGRGSPTSCSSTSPPAAGSGAAAGSSPSAGPAPTWRRTRSPRSRRRPGPRASTRTAHRSGTRSSPS